MQMANQYVPSGKAYSITTIKELVDVATTGNIKFLMTDLYKFIMTGKHLGDGVRTDVFRWLDDGDNTLVIQMRVSETDEPWTKEIKEEFIAGLSAEFIYNEATNEVKACDGSVTWRLPPDSK